MHQDALQMIQPNSRLTEDEEQGWGIARVGWGVEDDSECAAGVNVVLHELGAVLVDVLPPFCFVDEAVLVLV